jgi:hypothetical protein
MNLAKLGNLMALRNSCPANPPLFSGFNTFSRPHNMFVTEHYYFNKMNYLTDYQCINIMAHIFYTHYTTHRFHP